MNTAALSRRAFLTLWRQPSPTVAPAMNRPHTTTPAATTEPLKLPPLQQTVLDVATADALFRDLSACTRVLCIRPKHAPQTHTPEDAALTLEQARVRLATGLILGVQIRYAYEGHTWCDTLLRRPVGLTLIRIRESDISASVAHDHMPAAAA